MDLLNELYNFDLPEGVLEEDFNEIWQRLEDAKKNGNLDEDDKALSEQELRKDIKKFQKEELSWVCFCNI